MVVKALPPYADHCRGGGARRSKGQGIHVCGCKRTVERR